MHVAVCVRIVLCLSERPTEQANERMSEQGSEWERVNTSKLIAHAYWFSAMRIMYLYLSFACVKLLTFIFAGPNSQCDSAQHIQLKFYRRSVKSCLFFSLLNIAAAAAAAVSICSKRNLTKHIVPIFFFVVARKYPMWYFTTWILFIWWILCAKQTKLRF